MVMKLFKDNLNNIFAYAEDGSQDNFIGDKIAITQAEADAIIKERQVNEFNSLSYKDKRAAEYPSYADYLDGIVKGDNAQVQAYIDACLAIKAKYPKN
jgi:hypothetical protein